MNILRNNPNKRLGIGRKALILLAGGLLVGSLASCSQDYESEEVTTSIGIACSGGENVFISRPYTPGSEETPFTPAYAEESAMEEDEADYKYVLACETGAMEVFELDDAEGPDALSARPQLDAILNVTTKDKSGHRTTDGQTLGYATSQSVEIQHMAGDNMAYLDINNGDELVSTSVTQNSGVTELEAVS